MNLHLKAGTGMVIDIESLVDSLENQRVAVQNSDDFAGMFPSLKVTIKFVEKNSKIKILTKLLSFHTFSNIPWETTEL